MAKLTIEDMPEEFAFEMRRMLGLPENADVIEMQLDAEGAAKVMKFLGDMEEMGLAHRKTRATDELPESDD